jgi:hypothetical protein
MRKIFTQSFDSFKEASDYAKEASKSLQCDVRIKKDGIQKWSVVYFHTARFEFNPVTAVAPKNFPIHTSPKFKQQAIARQNSKKLQDGVVNLCLACRHLGISDFQEILCKKKNIRIEFGEIECDYFRDARADKNFDNPEIQHKEKIMYFNKIKRR